MAKVGTEKPKAKPKREVKPKLTDAERHKRFVDMAHAVQADESPDAFDRAFDRVVSTKLLNDQELNHIGKPDHK